MTVCEFIEYPKNVSMSEKDYCLFSIEENMKYSDFCSHSAEQVEEEKKNPDHIPKHST